MSQYSQESQDREDLHDEECQEDEQDAAQDADEIAGNEGEEETLSTESTEPSKTWGVKSGTAENNKFFLSLKVCSLELILDSVFTQTCRYDHQIPLQERCT